MKQKHNIEFDLLHDEGLRVARNYRLVYQLTEPVKQVYLDAFSTDLSEYNGSDDWELPLTARYVIDTDSVIRSADIRIDHMSRPEPEETVQVLRNL